MKLLSFAAALLIVTSALPAGEQKLNVPPKGFKALFNGKDLTGWKGLVGNPVTRKKMTPEKLAAEQTKADTRMRQHWQVKDGVIVFDGKGRNLCTARDYGNFELLVDWKIQKGGDSGIYIRGVPQVQIWDTADPRYFKHGAQKGSGSLWNNKKNPRFPLVKADKPAGEWNTFRIRIVGDKVTIHLNGKLVVDSVTLENFYQRDKPLFETGSIELQNHGNPLYFRNIFIKELSDEAPPTPKAGN